MVKSAVGRNLLYLCKCQDTKDPYKYRGSGTYWRRVINKYDCEIVTNVLGHYTTNAKLRAAGEFYSTKYDVVNSKSWANLVPELGDGGPTVIGRMRCYDPITLREKLVFEIPEGWIKGTPRKGQCLRSLESIERTRQFHIGKKRSKETCERMKQSKRKKRLTVMCKCGKNITTQNLKRHLISNNCSESSKS